MKESDHTPAAFSPPTTQGDTNPTQPSSGEQPTSVERMLENLFFEACPECKIDGLCRWHKIRVQYAMTHIETKLAEERRQAKIELWELLIGKEAVNDPSTIPDDFIQVPWSWIRVQLSKLRGENNE